MHGFCASFQQKLRPLREPPARFKTPPLTCHAAVPGIDFSLTRDYTRKRRCLPVSNLTENLTQSNQSVTDGIDFQSVPRGVS